MPDPYGGWDHWAMQGHGNMVSSAAPLLKFLDNYVVHGPNIGMPFVPRGTSNQNSHTGALSGTSTIAVQREDSINIVVLFNERNENAVEAIANAIRAIINNTENPIIWPTYCVDGFWLDFSSSSAGYGGHDDPFNTVSGMLSATSDGTRLHIKSGTSNWTGTISQKMWIDAPYGTATIGK